MTDAEKAEAIKAVVDILDEDFTADTECGKHGSLTLSCTACQAVIVKSWLIDASDLYYGTEISWKTPEVKKRWWQKKVRDQLDDLGN